MCSKQGEKIKKIKFVGAKLFSPRQYAMRSLQGERLSVAVSYLLCRPVAVSYLLHAMGSTCSPTGARQLPGAGCAAPPRARAPRARPVRCWCRICPSPRQRPPTSGGALTRRWITPRAHGVSASSACRLQAFARRVRRGAAPRMSALRADLSGRQRLTTICCMCRLTGDRVHTSAR